MGAIRSWGLVLALVGAGAAWAETPLDQRLIGARTVTLVETDDFARALDVDGLRLLEEGLILLDVPLQVGGVDVLTGVAGSGGNACDAAPFVLVLPATGPARLDGPLDTCAWLQMADPGPDALRFASAALPTLPGEVWVWTPEAGFTGPGAVEFAPDPALGGYDDLSALEGAHPVDVLRRVAVHDELRAGLGADWLRFAAVLEGLGSGGLVAQGYRGEACTMEVCEEEFAILWLDAGRGQAFVWWTEAGQAQGQGYPRDRAQWPGWVLEDLTRRLGG